ncbi:hypothetical protein [Mariniluteicoccus flavus]
MTSVWLGWGQEDPRASWRPWLGVGSVLGLVAAGLFGYGVFLRWTDGSALEGQYAWFGVLTAAEVIAAGLGAWFLRRRDQARWIAWWVAVVVAVHFLPLAVFLGDWSLVVLAVIQAVGLLVIRTRDRGSHPSSRVTGPFMGATLLVFAVASGLVFIARYGPPWAR